MNIPEFAPMPHMSAIDCQAGGEDTMFCRVTARTSRSRIVAITAAMLLASARFPAAAAEFPYDREMLLDVKPLPGSKRVPILEIGADGRAQVDFWCKSGMAQVGITGETITFALGPLREEGCTPDRSERDDAMIAAFSQPMQWRMEDDTLILTGAGELR